LLLQLGLAVRGAQLVQLAAPETHLRLLRIAQQLAAAEERMSPPPDSGGLDLRGIWMFAALPDFLSRMGAALVGRAFLAAGAGHLLAGLEMQVDNMAAAAAAVPAPLAAQALRAS
jgi:hypothetical protein